MAGDLDDRNHATPYMAYAVHLFKLAKLNSEIKYIANSVVRDANYAYPRVSDRYEWQRTMLDKLDEWYQAIPQAHMDSRYSSMETICQLRYHSLVILLTRPSPAILHPTSAALQQCARSCKASIHLYDRLYRDNSLVFSWTVFHGLLLSIITFLYCIRASPDVAQSIEADVMILDVCKGLNVLSAAGEYWPGAKRSRNILDDLLQDLSRWLRQSKAQQGGHSQVHPDSRQDVGGPENNPNAIPGQMEGSSQDYSELPAGLNASLGPQETDGMLTGTEDFLTNPFMGSWDFVNPDNLDDLMHNFFTELASPANTVL